MHGLETGDYVTFREVQGMEKLNGVVCQVKGMTTVYTEAFTPRCILKYFRFQWRTRTSFVYATRVPVLLLRTRTEVFASK